MPSSGFYVFIPVFNEESNLPIIASNIQKALEALGDVKFLISDNDSTDNTLHGLEQLRDQYPHVVAIHRQVKNVGFSRNMLAVELLPDDRKIILLGANDILHPPGLKKLAEVVNGDPTIELLICNWAYIEVDDDGTVNELQPGDVRNFFAVDRLDEYLVRQPFLPNGIMQWVASKRILLGMAAHVDTMSPHLGAFMDAFPCRCVAMPEPPLALVKLVEDRGWRSSFESIINTHLQYVELVSRLLRDALDRKNISHATYTWVGTRHLRVLWRLPLSSWGKTRGSLRARLAWQFRIFKYLIDINSRYRFEHPLYLVYGCLFRNVLGRFRESGRFVRGRTRMLLNRE